MRKKTNIPMFFSLQPFADDLDIIYLGFLNLSLSVVLLLLPLVLAVRMDLLEEGHVVASSLTFERPPRGKQSGSRLVVAVRVDGGHVLVMTINVTHVVLIPL